MVDVVALGAILSVCLFLGIFLFLELGFRLGRRHKAKMAGKAFAGLGAIEGAVFGLLGLLIAFTFSGAVERFNHRRDLIVEEANAIGTAYMRLDLLPASVQTTLKADFRDYTDTRLLGFRKLPDIAAAQVEFDRAIVMQQKIWNSAIPAARAIPSPAVLTLVAQGLNDMIDITSTRAMSLRMHPPLIVFIMLGILVLISSLIAGYGLSESAKRSWVHIVCFAVLMASTVYVIIDIELPRFGLVRVDDSDRAIVDVRNSMK